MFKKKIHKKEEKKICIENSYKDLRKKIKLTVINMGGSIQHNGYSTQLVLI